MRKFRIDMIKENLQKIRKEISRVCPERDVKIVAVTKNRAKKEILEAIKCGITIIGENRYQEARDKGITNLKVKKHFIGHLQTNKVKGAVQIFDMIESADSRKLIDKINSECEKINKIMPILIEVNISGEPQKNGCQAKKASTLISYIRTLPYVKIEGLMTIAPFTPNKEKIRKCFRLLKNLFDQIGNLKYLSMGMTDDYKIALEEGSNMVRIGRGVFGW